MESNISIFIQKKKNSIPSFWLYFKGINYVSKDIILSMVYVLNFEHKAATKKSRQTAQSQIRLILKKQSDQGLPLLLFRRAFCVFQPCKPTFYSITERVVFKF